MTLSTQPYKGARDFYPEDKRLQKYMFQTMREHCESFGYEEYDAPVLEPIELYLAKSNEEIVNEQTYTLTDRGGRTVAMRPEMTPSVSRMVAARRQELAYPARLFNIGGRWRYERPQRGRTREFFQLDCDIFGVDGVEAEHEIIQLADQIMRSFGAKPDMYTIRVNSRKLINWLFREYLGLTETQEDTMRRLIDRMHKMVPENFLAQASAILSPGQRESGVLEKLTKLMSTRYINNLPEGAESLPSVLLLKQLSDLLEESHIHNVKFDITLMRGFDYYTDIVFEVFDEHPENNRSMFGGGRYDGLVGLFGVEPVPTVGFGMGDVTLQNFLEGHGIIPKFVPETDAYVILLGSTVYEKAQNVLARLREEGLKLAVDTTARKPEKQIKTAVKKGIQHIIFIGEAELADDRYKLKQLASGVEETHGVERIVATLLDYRRRHMYMPAASSSGLSDDEEE
ncbi:histidine--tRNA ligase [Candidatus Saccharibacteria bacterium]|nr:MAG: histidine--tRNA ligase [Candidatus Saccharibacteria bacterium]PID99299.1 MAG: histidine--tRNA ligase [Candidatus Saccharibacteria bacterium]